MRINLFLTKGSLHARFFGVLFGITQYRTKLSAMIPEIPPYKLAHVTNRRQRDSRDLAPTFRMLSPNTSCSGAVVGILEGGGKQQRGTDGVYITLSPPLAFALLRRCISRCALRHSWHQRHAC